MTEHMTAEWRVEWTAPTKPYNRERIFDSEVEARAWYEFATHGWSQERVASVKLSCRYVTEWERGEG